MRKQEATNRAETMAALYRAGRTLQQIGDQYGITRERVRQIITRKFGIRRFDGGVHKRSEPARAERQHKLDARYFAKHGCSFAQYTEMKKVGRALMDSGVGRDRTPIGAFQRQRNSARNRGIGWELRFWDWWQVWQHSGKWGQRGRGHGYCMARFNDSGAYAPGNVKIIRCSDNASEANNKYGLPMGVRKNNKNKTNPYFARRMIGGEMRYLGAYNSPDLAHAAYLMAGQS